MNTVYKLALSLLLASSMPAFAGEWDFTGFVGADVRAFWQESRFTGQDDEPNASLIVQPEIYWQNAAGNRRFGFVGFGRADSHDSERTHVDIREAHWSLEGSSWDFNIGINKVFWGVAESRHLVDVINQTDLVEDIDQEDKLGQPLVNFNLQRDYGRFEFFVLPYFRERTFAGTDGRLRPPLPVDTGTALYESSDEENHVDYAIRYNHFFGDVDIAVYAFDGTSREPLIVPAADGQSILPYYEQMTQAGLELQYTNDAWLWKLEAVSRDAASDSFFATVGGFEYTFYGVRESAVDIGLLIEYLYDGRNASAPITAFDNDIFVGTRLAMNDAEDTSILAGFAIDNDTQELFLNVEAERRFGANMVAELRLRAFANADADDSLYAIEQDDYVQLRLSWFY